MAKQSIITLKAWFKKGLKPLESQFADWLDSFWHKDNSIPITSITNLQSTLNSLAPLSVVNAINDELDLKLNAADYNDRFKGKYTTLIALQAAHPVSNIGDYAQVDSGAGDDVVNYNWDSEEGWIKGGSGSSATNTDALPEGAINLYFTAARVIAALPGTAPTQSQNDRSTKIANTQYVDNAFDNTYISAT